MTTPDWTSLADLLLRHTQDGHVTWRRYGDDAFFTVVESPPAIRRTHVHADLLRDRVTLRIVVDPGVNRGGSEEMKLPALAEAIRASAAKAKAEEDGLALAQVVAALESMV